MVVKEINNITLPIKEDLARFNIEFRQSLNSNVPIINTIIKYLLKNKGKQLRPILCLLSAKICGKINNDSYTSASLIEMLHVATLIHDDVVDSSELRHGWPTINRIWKNKLSILVGDYIFSKALSNMVKINSNEALSTLSSTAEKLSEGEILQIERAIKRDMSEEVYYDMIRNKTASLFSATCKIGAMTTTKSDHKINSLSMFGEYLGMAFQIKDDLFDLIGTIDKTGKPIGFDVKKNMLTLPYIYIISSSNKEQVKKIKSILKNVKKTELSTVRSLIEEYGGISYAEKKMKEFSMMAIEELTTFEKSDVKDSLISLVEYNLNRFH
tara:strand:- start:15 stop:992 length:978 start_codon:yes stop_codon:yes gene_type:complete